MAANVKAGIKMDATDDEFKVNPVCQDLTTSKHNLAEGRPRRKLEFISVRFTVALVNLRVVKER